MRQKGFILVPIIIIISLIGIAIAYSFGTKKVNISLTATPSPTPSTTSVPTQAIPTAKPTNIATPTPTNIKTLQYKLPTGWKTIKDTSGTLELGYDPSKYDTSSITDKRIDLKYISNGFFGGTVRILDYDGGSRHKFLLEASGAGSSFDKTDYYFEKEYYYNGKSCLLISGAYVSASLDTWMMCNASGGKAIFVNTQGEKDTTSLMSTVKVLK